MPRLPAAVAAVAAVWGAAARQPVKVTSQALPGHVAGGSDEAAAFVSAAPPRLLIDPSSWSVLSPTGRDVVLRHELTHLATAGTDHADARLPAWLVEGAAEWTAWSAVAWPDERVAPELAALVRTGRSPAQLPTDADLSPSAPDAAAQYSSAWLAVREIVRRAGPAGLVRLVRSLEQHPHRTFAAVLWAETGDTLATLQQRWQLAVSRLS